MIGATRRARWANARSVPDGAECLTKSRDTRSICVELEGVTFIDSPGRILLRTMHEEGAALAGSGCMTRAILEEITRR